MKVEDEEYWQKCYDCFSSLPVADLGNEPAEHWFTEDHDHDKKALVLNETTNNYTNTLVNPERKIADERGTKELILNASKYTGEEVMVLDIIQHYWIYSIFWTNY